jgi:hypothetical protein
MRHPPFGLDPPHLAGYDRMAYFTHITGIRVIQKPHSRKTSLSAFHHNHEFEKMKSIVSFGKTSRVTLKH